MFLFPIFMLGTGPKAKRTGKSYCTGVASLRLGQGEGWALHLGWDCVFRATGLLAPVGQVAHCSRALLRGE